MIWQIGDSLPFDFAYIASKLGKTGIAVTIKAAYKNGVAIPALVGVAIPEIGNGLFRYSLDGANVDAIGDYVIIATTADATVDQRDLYAVNVVTAWVADVDAAISTRGTADPGDAMALTAGERTTLAGVIWNTLTTVLTTAGGIGKFIIDYLTAIAAKTALIGTGKAVATVPIAAAGDVAVIRGDSYLNVDGRRLEWEDVTWAIAATSTLAVIIQDVRRFTATRLSATEVGLELTGAQTLALPVVLDAVPYSLQEIKNTGERITLAQGSWRTTTRPVPLT